MSKAAKKVYSPSLINEPAPPKKKRKFVRRRVLKRLRDGGATSSSARLPSLSATTSIPVRPRFAARQILVTDASGTACACGPASGTRSPAAANKNLWQ